MKCLREMLLKGKRMLAISICISIAFVDAIVFLFSFLLQWVYLWFFSAANVLCTLLIPDKCENNWIKSESVSVYNHTNDKLPHDSDSTTIVYAWMMMMGVCVCLCVYNTERKFGAYIIAWAIYVYTRYGYWDHKLYLVQWAYVDLKKKKK